MQCFLLFHKMYNYSRLQIKSRKTPKARSSSDSVDHAQTKTIPIAKPSANAFPATDTEGFSPLRVPTEEGLAYLRR